jgi:hypothetical protein
MRTIWTGLIGLVVLTACSAGPQLPVTHPPKTHGSRAGEGRGQPRPGDVVLTPANNMRTVTIRLGQAVAVVLPFAVRITASWHAQLPVPPPGTGVHSAPMPVVLRALGGNRFRATHAGDAWLRAFRLGCTGTVCSQASSWLVHLKVARS